MSKLGYTWFPQDWWTSETFKRLKRFPLVRYTIRELFDLMYKEGKPIEMNREYLIDDFNIELSDKEFEKLMEYIDVTEDGKWWINSIKKRISKAEASRQNGKKGGRPRKTQKPTEKTQQENPTNPPLEREREKKVNIKESEIKDNDIFTSIETLKSSYLENEKLINAVISVKKNKLKSKDEISKRLEQFNSELKSKSVFQKTWNDYTSHFLNWHRKTVDQNNNSSNDKSEVDQFYSRIPTS